VCSGIAIPFEKSNILIGVPSELLELRVIYCKIVQIFHERRVIYCKIVHIFLERRVICLITEFD